MNRFPRVIGVRLGYDPEQVDELILRIERTLGRGRLDGPPVTADEIRGAKFGVKLGGYNETAVDFALDAFIVAVEARGSSAAELPPRETPDLDSVLQTAEDQGEHARSHESGTVTTELSLRHEDASVSEPEGVPETGSGARGDAGVGERAGSRTYDPAGRSEAAQVEESGRAKAEAEGSGGARAGSEENGDARTGSRESESGSARSESRRARAEAKRGGLDDAEPGDTWEAEATRVERMAFRPGRLGMGYREQDVDALLDRVVATLRGTTDQPVTAEQIRTATFTTVVFRSGYAISEVDRFLADLAGVLERRALEPETSAQAKSSRRS
ncbi:hypothetical protein GCM10023194_64350 [Planotetraspora phitsanulokensis]|uniref:DivIVA domain-containing protein n=1 Tax=Planotetraspora phitsanulokensis TaxID=575192 RepID=A0A8J3XEH8_9ACTN|nr:DivIVA domain-containing protein [Planotetraspora phitsanulokensis]GII38512.1 hypothetical protein Pph01_35150 [Planotetraspora phitsanulokensis]